MPETPPDPGLPDELFPSTRKLGWPSRGHLAERMTGEGMLTVYPLLFGAARLCLSSVESFTLHLWDEAWDFPELDMALAAFHDFEHGRPTAYTRYHGRTRHESDVRGA